MRKMLLVVVASGALIALMPATALAKHHSRRHHHVRHARIHHRRIGRDPAPTTTPTTMPSAPATVASFDATTGVLMLTLADGSTVSGTVTADTHLVCISPTTGEGPGDDQGDDQGDQGGGDQAHFDGDSGGGGDDQGQGDDDQNQTCTTANLMMMGTPVQFADLSIGMSGATWDTVVLVTAPSTTPVVPDTDNDGM